MPSGEALAPGPPSILKKVSPEDIHPQIPSRPGGEPRGRLQGVRLLPTKKDGEELKGRALERRLQESPSPGAQPQLCSEMAAGPQACHLTSLDFLGHDANDSKWASEEQGER